MKFLHRPFGPEAYEIVFSTAAAFDASVSKTAAADDAAIADLESELTMKPGRSLVTNTRPSTNNAPKSA